MKIIGLKKSKNSVIKNPKGDIVKFISKKDKEFKNFGEIYFSEINYKKHKGWNLHKTNTCIIACCYGSVIFKFIDGRKNSRTFQNEKIITLKKSNYGYIKIPPGIWFSFTTNSKKSILINLINNIHSDKEVIKSSKVKNYLIK